jgi:hypothetical protein
MLWTGGLLDPLKGLCHDASPVDSRLAAAVSYRAAWSLPGPDFHRLAGVNFAQGHRVVDHHLICWVPRYLGTPETRQRVLASAPHELLQKIDREKGRSLEKTAGFGRERSRNGRSGKDKVENDHPHGGRRDWANLSRP